MKHRFFLFDMDGVLLQPFGYHQALQASVRWIGIQLGYKNAALSMDAIAHFESIGITNEWDSLAICTCYLLLNAWKTTPDLRLDNAQSISRFIEAPDFMQFLSKINGAESEPFKRVTEHLLHENGYITPKQTSYLHQVLQQAQNIETSETLPVQQEFVLGSAQFSEIYNLPSQLDTPSYLLTRDKPHLTPANLSRIKQVLNNPNHHAVIFTNRPDTPPYNFPSTPEAEAGRELVGLDELPILGSGTLTAFAHQQTPPLPVYFKPHPLHALSAMLTAFGVSVQDALQQAYALINHNSDESLWGMFHNAEVFIFEDSVGGLKSGMAAQALLKQFNVHINLDLIGVSAHPRKAKALAAVTDQVIQSLNEFDWERFETQSIIAPSDSQFG